MQEKVHNTCSTCINYTWLKKSKNIFLKKIVERVRTNQKKKQLSNVLCIHRFQIIIVKY